MTATQLLALPDDQFDALPVETITRILHDERRALKRLDRRQKQLRDLLRTDPTPKTLEETAAAMGISRERVRQLQKIALLKLRRQYPTVQHLLEASSAH